MPIASRLKWYLDVNRAEYEVVAADEKDSEGAPFSKDQLVVSQLFHIAGGYVIAVIPASHEIAMPALEELIGRPLQPAKESELRDIFFDCEKGVVPPLGPAYGIPTVVDDSLRGESDLYFVAGADDLVHMSSDVFGQLIADAKHGTFTQAA